MRVTPDNLFRLQKLKKKFAEEEAQHLVEMREMAGRLDGTFWFGICEEDLVCERIGHEFTFTVP